MIEYLPVEDIIHVLPDQQKVTRGGLHLPDSDRGPAKYFNGMGVVLACGPGKFEHGVMKPMPCKKGDRILFQIQPHNVFKPHAEEILMIAGDQVLAVVVGEESWESAKVKK